MTPELSTSLEKLRADILADASKLPILFWLRAYATLAQERGTPRIRWAKLSGFVSRTAREFGINGLDHAPGRALLTDYALFQVVAPDVGTTHRDRDEIRALDLPRGYEIELLPEFGDTAELATWAEQAWEDFRRSDAASGALAGILARWAPAGASGLLPTLIEAQELYGWLSKETLVEIGRGLGVPLSHVYGVADFYAHLYTHAVGKTFVRVCDDVPCFLAGSESICQAVQAQLRLAPTETTPDGKFTFEVVACLGHCDRAPVLMIGHSVHENVQPADVTTLLGER